MDSRTSLKPGTILNLPGMECTILEEIGRGSNALVYRGWYADELTAGGRHLVLIKELFPLHHQGFIRRLENNHIFCSDEARELYDTHLLSFERGNRAHLQLLENAPDLIGGNINSFALHSTFYTVLDYTGGHSLEQAVRLHHTQIPLKTTVLRMMKLLHSLDAFHSSSLLHLDISPDNAMIVGRGEQERVMLIDYNSVHSMEEVQSGSLFFQSIKSGYTAPEIRMPSRKPLSAAADLFSVAAVFFFCLNGRPLTPYEMVCKEPPDVSDCACLADASEPVKRMVRSILRRGLTALPSRRYSSIAQMLTDFQELIDRIDGIGITHWALWEAGRQQTAAMIRLNPALSYVRESDTLYPIRVQHEDGSVIGMTEAVDRLLTGENKTALLLGNGGLGKTTALIQTALEYGKRYSSVQTAVIYIPLYGWTTEQRTYITDHILEYMRFRSDRQNLADARHALHALMNRPINSHAGQRPAVLLLLDGLNETPVENELLLQEICELSALEGVGLLISSRSKISSDAFPLWYMSPLTDADVSGVLSKNGLALPEAPAVQSLLRTPLMLSIFVTASLKSDKQLTVATGDELLDSYFQALQDKEDASLTDNADLKWQTAAALRLILPAIAAECTRKSTSLTSEQLLDAINRCRKIVLNSSYLRRTFPEWIGHGREIMGGCQSAEEWLGLIVQKILWQRLGLLIQDGQGGYRPSHQDLSEYLCKIHGQTKHIITRRKISIRLTAATVIAFCLGTGITAVSSLSPSEPPAVPYDEKAALTVYDQAESCYLQAESMVMGMLDLLNNPENPSVPYASFEAMLNQCSTMKQGDYALTMLVLMESDRENPLPSDLEEAFEVILLDPSQKIMPWSGKTLNMNAYRETVLFAQTRAAEYAEFLDILHYASTDPRARFGGYHKKIFPYILSIVESDALILTGSYHLSCNPHLTADWKAYRSNPTYAQNYDLYTEQIAGTFASDPDQIETLIANASARRVSLKNEMLSLGVIQGYEQWKESSS